MLQTPIVPQTRPDVKVSAASGVNPTQNRSLFPESLALDINDIINVCEEKAHSFYYVKTKSYIIAPNGNTFQRYRAEYTTLVPYNDTAPTFVLEQNMFGFYIINLATGLIDDQKHMEFTRLIQSRNIPVTPVVTDPPPIIIKSQIVHKSDTNFSYTLRSDGFESVVRLTTAPDGSLLEWPVSATQEAHIIKIMNVQPVPSQQTSEIILVGQNNATLIKTSAGWKAESKSSPGAFHTASHDGSSCSCHGFNGRYNKCWHTATVRAYVARQEGASRIKVGKVGVNTLIMTATKRYSLGEVFK